MTSIIAAISTNHALGKDNNLIWHLPADLKRFKKVTAGHHVIMGRKTYESLGRPLPKRTNIIITRDPNFKAEGCVVVHSLQDALDAAKKDSNPYILGGAEIYRQSMDIVDELDLTFVHHEFEADVFFPEIDPLIWNEVSRQDFKRDASNKYDYSFVLYKKRILNNQD